MKDKALIGNSFFASNRARLLKKLDGGTPIILSANGLLQRTRDDDVYPFEQDGNFWYLSGIDEPDVILVIDNSEEYLILPQRNARHKIFSEQTDKDAIKAISSIDKIYDYEEGWKKLSSRLKDSGGFSAVKPPAEYLDVYDAYTNPAARNLIKKIRAVKSGLKQKDVTKEIIKLRMIKTKTETDCIRQAIRFTSEVLVKISENISNYQNERDIAADLNDFYFRHNLQHAFTPIVASGKNASVLHYQSNKSPIARDDIVLVDTGAKFNNYCSDITRVIVKNPSNRQTAVHKAVVEAQTYAMSLLKPGVNFKEYEISVAKFIGSKLRELGLIKEITSENIRKYYPHSTSHSLGIDVHDPADYSRPLQADMVITVEPGIYIPEENIGVRIEDDVLITEDGVESLSSGLSANIDKLSIIS